MLGRANERVKCTVEQCKYHNDGKECCSLDSIQVGTHEPNPTKTECVDCQSFMCK